MFDFMIDLNLSFIVSLILFTLEDTHRQPMKHFTDQQVDDLLKLKFGSIVTKLGHTSYISDRVLGKVFGVSASKIRSLYLARFEHHRVQNLSFAARL